MNRCPSCGHEIAKIVPIDQLAHMPLSTVRRTIIRALVNAYPGSITSDDLINAVYGGVKRGGPDNIRNTLSVHMCFLRGIIPQYGWNIPVCKGGKTAHYHLEPLA